jgi:hypothetical protein
MFDIDSQVCYTLYLINKVNKMAKKKPQSQYNKIYKEKHNLTSVRLNKQVIKDLADLKILFNAKNLNEVVEKIIEFHKINKY